MVPSDGNDHPLHCDLSRQLLITLNSRRNFTVSGRSEHKSTHYPDLNLYRRILTDDNSVTGRSDIESSAGPE